MAISMFLMWWLMMIAMMTPSAAPTLLLFHNLKKIGSEGKKALSYTYLFLFGYLIIWAIFSLIACIIHKFFDTSSIADAAMMQLKSVQFSGILLITAGVYQFTPLKNACLEKCRTPIDFLSSNNRKGAKGSFIMGAHHGLFCLGCCWALMALLFVGGVMNLFWITGLALYVLIEKIIIKAGWLDKIMGLILIFFGTSLLI
jgi:predicted metal-binding membrane protein